MNKKSISWIVLAAITISVILTALLSLTFTTSAAVVDNVAYRYKLTKNVSINPATYMSGSGDLMVEGYITLSNGMSGNGYIGYSSGAGSFYVQINQYVTSGASWCLKYDSTGHWWYRDAPSDYVSDWTNYQNYNEYQGDIYIDLNDGSGELPGYFLSAGIVEDTTQYLYLYDVDYPGIYSTLSTISGKVILPEALTKEGYIFTGWSDGWQKYMPGEMYTMPFAYDSDVPTFSLSSTYREDPEHELHKNHYLLFYYNDELYWYKDLNELEDGERYVDVPDVPSGDPNDPDKFYWHGGSSYLSPGETVDVVHDSYIYSAVYGDIYSFTYPDQDGSNSVDTVFVTLGDKITMPEAKGYKEGYAFDGWSDGALIYVPGRAYNVDSLKNHELTAVYVPIGNGGSGEGEDGGGNNFVVSFFSDIFDGLKENITPYLEDVKIPFLEITLADVVSFLFWGIIAWILIILVTKVIGAIT